MIFLDSDVFLHPFFPRNPRFRLNQELLDAIADRSKATSIYNLLEICGVLSFNVSMNTLVDYFNNFERAYNVWLLFPFTGDLTAEEFHDELIFEAFRKIQQRMRLGDAIALLMAEEHHSEAFVTNNKPHFENRTWIPVYTPEEFLNLRE